MKSQSNPGWILNFIFIFFLMIKPGYKSRIYRSLLGLWARREWSSPKSWIPQHLQPPESPPSFLKPRSNACRWARSEPVSSRTIRKCTKEGNIFSWGSCLFPPPPPSALGRWRGKISPRFPSTFASGVFFFFFKAHPQRTCVFQVIFNPPFPKKWNIAFYTRFVSMIQLCCHKFGRI